MPTFTNEHALRALRPSINSWASGRPTQAQITQKAQEMNVMSDADKKELRRSVDPADSNDLRDLIDDLTDRITRLENRRDNQR